MKERQVRDTAVSINDYLRKLNKDRVKRRRFSTFLLMLSLIVSVGVVWELRSVGISMTNETDCGIEEHIHSPSCYQTLQICGLEEGTPESNDEDAVLHVHSDACYEQKLICEMEEHVHTVACVDLGEGPVAESDAAITDASDERLEAPETGEPPETEELSEEEASEQEREVNQALLEALGRAYGEEITDEELLELYYEMLEEYPEYTEEELLAFLEEETVETLALSQDKIDSVITEVQSYIPEEIEENRIYVVTANGVRDKDKVHEYLDVLNWIGGAHDDQYIDNSNNYLCRYALDAGDTVILVAYSKTSSDSWIFSVDEDYDKSLIRVDGRKPVARDGYYISATAITVLRNPSTRQSFQVGYYTGAYDSFWIDIESVNDEDTPKYTHADIEITDGGYFETKTIVKYPNSDSVYQIVSTKYESWVSNIHDCYIYDSSNTQIAHFLTSDYEQMKEAGSTQFELTSQYKCVNNENKHYSRDAADHARFDVDLRLTPKSMTVTTFNSDGSQAGAPVVYDNLQTGEDYDILVEHAIFDLDRQSVVDAKNKCPNHSGLDFNVLSMEKTVDIVPPAQATLGVNKSFVSGDLSQQSFGFSLTRVDEEGLSNVDETNVTPTYTNPTGQVSFETIKFYAPGTYHYKISENVPAGAVKMGDQFYYNGVLYDAREIDVYVDVEIVEDLLSLLFSNGTDSSATLVATVRYELNGQPVTPPFLFQNEKVTYTFKDMAVRKVWTTADHPASVSFRMIQKNETTGEERVYTDSGGTMVYLLNSANNWERTIQNLPMQAGDTTYSYRVEETAITGYVPTYSYTEGDMLNCTITNRSANEAQINVSKQWQDQNGNLQTASEIPVSSVDAVLRRRYQETEVPVTIRIRKVGTESYTDEFVKSAYAGGNLVFRLDETGGYGTALSLGTYSGCNATISNHVVTLSNIQPNAVVVLEYDPGVILWHTDGDTFQIRGGNNTWDDDGDGELNACYNTRYSAASSGSSALQVRNRRVQWDDAILQLDPNEYKPGNKYSINAFMMYRSTSADTGGASTAVAAGQKSRLHLTLYVEGNLENGERNWIGITSLSGDADYWYQLQNVNFTIPTNLGYNIQKMYLQITSSEFDASGNEISNSTNIIRPDIAFDDVIIGRAGLIVTTTASGPTGASSNNAVSVMRSFTYTEQSKSVPNDLNVWKEDTGFAQNITLSAPNWNYQMNSETLAQSQSNYRVYQYYVVETTTLEAYKTSYQNTNVSTNTADTPIVIQNRYAAYRLPDTGGVGARNVQLLGLITLLGTGLAGVYIKKRRRRSSA